MSRGYAGCWLSLPAALLLVLSVGCVNRPIEKPAEGGQKESPHYFPQSVEKDIDILFVIDNSNSMGEEQANLNQNFPNFIEALRVPALNNKIPNVRIGVVSTDLGAGNYSLPSCEVANGDGGRLQGASILGDPWIEYIEGKTNINLQNPADPIEKVKEAFKQVAALGTGGCGYEHTIEAARRALDGKTNPGFLRQNAFLAVVFITDEDDCSAQKPQLFDPNQNSISDPLGFLTSFRCFEFGIDCDCAGGAECSRTIMGPRKNCKPGQNWLYKIEDYITFFKGLKPPGRTIMFAIAGPTDKVEVGMDGKFPALKPSCQTTRGKGVPAIRIKTLVDAFEDKGHFNAGTDPTLKQSVPVNICSDDFSPALRLLGKIIVATLGGQCISSPPLTRNGGIACKAGDPLGDGKTCAEDCLHMADCIVTQIENQGTAEQKSTNIPKCDPSKFQNAGDTDCGAICPCWRIVPKKDCSSELDGSPYGLEVLRKGDAPKGSVAEVRCATTSEAWGSAPFAALPQCT